MNPTRTPRRSAVRRIAAGSLLLFGSALIPSSAHAGMYETQVCQNGYGNGAFGVTTPVSSQFAWRPTNNCDLGWNGWNGLSVSVTDGPQNPLSDPDVIPVGTVAGLIAGTPPGVTGIERVWVGSGRLGSYYGNTTGFNARVQLPDDGWCVTDGDRGGSGHCPGGWHGGTDNSQNTDWYSPSYPGRLDREYGPITYTTKSIIFDIVCNGGSTAPGGRCYRAQYKPSAGVAIAHGSIRYRDNTPPAIGSISGKVASGQWQKPGPLTIGGSASAPSGIRVFQGFVDGAHTNTWDQVCDYSLSKPCWDRSLPTGADGQPTNTISVGGNYDGRHTVVLRAAHAADQQVDCAYDCADASTTAYTDGTAPGAATSVVNTRDSWQKVNSFPFTASAPASENDPDGAGPRGQSPIVSRTLTVCPSNVTQVGPTCASSTASVVSTAAALAPTVTVPTEGDWRVRYALNDAAGNAGTPSAWVRAAYDATAPALAVQEKANAIDVTATDALSGVATVRVKIDGGPWTTYSSATTTIPLAPGRHDVLVDSIDKAGNNSNPTGTDSGAKLFSVTVIDPNASNVDGLKEVSTSTVTNTVTVPGDGSVVVIDRGAWNGTNASEKATITAWYQRADSKPTKRRSAAKKLGSEISKPTGLTKRVAGTMDRPVIRGRLVNDKGVGIGAAKLDLLSVIPGGTRLLDKSGTTTRADGQFTIALPRNQTSRSLTFGYRARVNDEKAVASTTLELVVKSRVTFGITNARVGKVAKLSGSISARYLDAKGVVVSLQYRDGGAWRTFATVRTDGKGQWATTYRFSKPQRVQLRAFVPSSPGYPYKGGPSRVVNVSIR